MSTEHKFYGNFSVLNFQYKKNETQTTPPSRYLDYNLNSGLRVSRSRKFSNGRLQSSVKNMEIVEGC